MAAAPDAPGTPEDPQDARVRSARELGARDAGVVLAWFVVVGVLGGVLWWWWSPGVGAIQTEQGPGIDPGDLDRQVGVDAAYALIAAVGGVASGLVLLQWRQRDPLLMVVLVAVGGGVAAMIALYLGTALGPSDPTDRLADAAVGTQAPLDLRLQAVGGRWLWSAAAVLGALLQLLVLRKPDRPDVEPYDDHGGDHGGDHGDEGVQRAGDPPESEPRHAGFRRGWRRR